MYSKYDSIIMSLEIKKKKTLEVSHSKKPYSLTQIL